MPRAHDPRGVPADRQPSKGMGGPIPDFGQYTDFTDTLGLFIEGLLKQIKDWTGIDLYWMLDWSWTTNTILEVIRQANDLTAWLQNPIQRPPNLLWRPGFSSPSAIADAPDWSWDAVVSLGTVDGPNGLPRTDPQGSALTTADNYEHELPSNLVTEGSVLAPGQFLTCQIHALVESGFTAADDMAIRMELVPSIQGVRQEPIVLANCGVPVDDPVDWIAAPVGSHQVFFDVDYQIPDDSTADGVELQLVVSESAGGNAKVRFDGGRLAASGGFLVVLADLFDAGRRYLTDSWKALEKWLNSSFTAEDWTTLADELQEAWDRLFVDVNRALRILGASDPFGIGHIFQTLLTENPLFGWIVKIATIVGDYLGAVFEAVMWWFFGLQVGGPYAGVEPSTFIGDDRAPFSSALWDHLVTVFVDGFRDMAVALLEALGIDVPDEVEDKPLSDIIRALLVENPVVGWLFKIGFAVTDWVGDLWTGLLQWMFGVGAGTPYPDATVGTGSTDDRKAFSKALWDNLITICTDGFDAMVIKILEALGMTQPSDGKDRSLNAIIKAMLMENPVVGWLFKIGFALQDWVKESWDALADWILGDPTFVGSAKDKLPFSSALWDSMASRLSAAWTTLLDAINDAIDGEVKYLSSLADIIRNLLVENPVFGWLFKIGYAVTDYLTETFDAIADWAFGGFTTALWNSMQTRMNAAWTVMTDAIGDALDKTFTRNKSPNDLISDALKSNPWFGWLFTMVDSWLQPVLTVGKAVTDFGDAVWHAITVFAANAASPTAWSTLTSAITNAWNTMVDAILDAWGSNKTHADFANPASATEAALKNNPVTGWLWGNSFDGGNWLNDSIHAITDPINSFFDSVRRFINQMVQPLHWGYFDSNWAWKASTSTPLTALPGGGGQLLTPGVSSDSGGMSWQADSTIPPAPTGVSAIPWWDLSVSGFPAGNVTYGISAVKGGKEGPAALVSVFVGTLSPPNVNGRVDLSWSAVSGADSYRVYRQVDATYSTTDWRLVASPLQAYSLLSPLSDKTARSGGTVAHPKTDAELSGQIVTALNTKTQNLTSSGTLATSSLTGNLDSGRVNVPGWTSLTEFAASTFGQWALTSNPGSIPTATVAGTYRLPTTLLNAMSFNGRDVVQSGQGGMKFTRQGWYSFIISFQMLSATSQYAIGAVLLNSGGSIFLEGASFINPAFSTGFNPTVQCVGLVNISSSQVNMTFYPGYTITGTTDAKFNTSSGKSATYISATFIK